MDKKYVTFPPEFIKWCEKMGQPLSVDENGGMIVEGIFDYGCVGDPGTAGLSDDLPEWIEENKRPSSTTFICPYCGGMVFYYHGSSSRSRRNGKTKRCLYRFCPWCGREVAPMRINYIEDDKQ